MAGQHQNPLKNPGPQNREVTRGSAGATRTVPVKGMTNNMQQRELTSSAPKFSAPHEPGKGNPAPTVIRHRG